MYVHTYTHIATHIWRIHTEVRAHYIKWIQQAEQMRGLHLFQEEAIACYASWMLNVTSTQHSCTAASYNQALYAREQSAIWATYSQSTPDTQQLSSTSHQAPLPPSGCSARGETLLLKILYPEAKTFNGHCSACYMRRWDYNHQPRTVLGFDSTERLFIIQLF